MTWVRIVLAALMLIASSGVRAAVQAASTNEPGRVSVRLYDYADLDEREQQRAQRQVSRAYAAIGVLLDWLGPIRLSPSPTAEESWSGDRAARIAVIVLSADMALRHRLGPETAGFAPITHADGGRVAYVVGDRVERIARIGRVDTSGVLAGVITHEIAHLLMPERSHSAFGMMRAQWHPEEFRNLDRQRFSEPEAASIRRSVRALDDRISRVAD
jgi:hypothetical protein